MDTEQPASQEPFTPAPSDSNGAAATPSAPPADPADAADAGAPAHPTGPDTPRGREFRAAELAETAGITTRTLRFYRERKLLPPPRREGRIAWYDEHHLARLRTISGLLARGHTLGGITELLDAFESGRDTRSTAELLGLDSSLSTFSEEVPVRLTPEELADHFHGQVTVENLAASLDIGYVAVDGDTFVHVSRRLLDASSSLVDKGVPLSAVLEAGRELRRHTDAIAATFTELFRSHLLPPDEPAPDAGTVNAALERVRPLAKQVVEAELGLALDRHLRTLLEPPPANPPEPTDEPTSETGDETTGGAGETPEAAHHPGDGADGT
ncbi:MerR family transcriptional regulator [Streptomyces sp. AJS327]|uniref:MerR family transcriptional regulator n=1 Tax=Streptomyces sp. AJS327 TaxID=2545265 RepID=UPI0015DEBCAC|nr:MerR family transcriptional regulator [Streptomyces sp. AJS327]MBA0049354.1 MerR family transcriptional regulator [Streptomyces sp. AJS327]